MRLLRRSTRLPIAFLALALIAVGTHGSTISADDPTSISGAGSGNWTTPPVGSDLDYARTAAPRYMLQDAPRPASSTTSTFYGSTIAPAPTPAVLPGTPLSSGPDWSNGSITSVPAADVTEIADPGNYVTYAEWPADVTTETAPDVIAAPPPVFSQPSETFAAPGVGVPCDPPAVATTRGTRVPVNPCQTYSGCGLPCSQGISDWHVRALVGRAFFSGDDTPEDCGYAGLDIGRTFCGCWGLDFYYRWNSGRFDRVGWIDDADNPVLKDGGDIHHVGLKFTYEGGFGQNSSWYWWTGIGGGYFWTDGYIDDDEGAEVFGELGVGYLINRNIRIRGGVNVHGMDTSVGRTNIANRGQSRFLWVIAPVIGIEFDF